MDIGGEPRVAALPRPGAAAGAERPTAATVVVFSGYHLIAQGLVDLLPEAWRDSAVIITDPAPLAAFAPGALGAAVIDAGAPDAEHAAVLARAAGGSVVVLVHSAEEPLAPALYEAADAVVVRDEVEARVLRLALAAGRVGMRLLPRSLPAAAPVGRTVMAAPSGLGEPAQRALELLAQGLRDAEIALQLNLSESAVRKLIQRAVKRAGARTRCQAVAAAVRGGELA
jgi:DNA-binding NarL/FixJ family response regulator